MGGSYYLSEKTETKHFINYCKPSVAFFNPSTTDDVYLSCIYGHMLSVGAIHFEHRFCASKKGGIGGGGWVSAQGAMHVVTALAGCKKALVGTGLSISLLFDTNGCR